MGIYLLIEPLGDCIEVFVDTSLEKCRRHDIRGLQAKTWLGIIKKFLGISDFYKIQLLSEIVIDINDVNPETPV